MPSIHTNKRFILDSQSTVNPHPDRQNDIRSQYRKRQQISRIIKHLMQQLPETTLLLPSEKVIDSWVHTALRHTHVDGNDWQKIIFHTLQAIYRLHKTSPLGQQQGFNSDNSTTSTTVPCFLLRLLLATDSETVYFR